MNPTTNRIRDWVGAWAPDAHAKTRALARQAWARLAAGGPDRVSGTWAAAPLAIATREARRWLARRLRTAADGPLPPRPRSPDLLADVVHWGRSNPDLVASLVLGVGAAFGPARLRALRAALSLLPGLVGRTLRATAPATDPPAT